MWKNDVNSARFRRSGRRRIVYIRHLFFSSCWFSVCVRSDTGCTGKEIKKKKRDWNWKKPKWMCTRAKPEGIRKRWAVLGLHVAWIFILLFIATFGFIGIKVNRNRRCSEPKRPEWSLFPPRIRGMISAIRWLPVIFRRNDPIRSIWLLRSRATRLNLASSHRPLSELSEIENRSTHFGMISFDRIDWEALSVHESSAGRKQNVGKPAFDSQRSSLVSPRPNRCTFSLLYPRRTTMTMMCLRIRLSATLIILRFAFAFSRSLATHTHNAQSIRKKKKQKTKSIQQTETAGTERRKARRECRKKKKKKRRIKYKESESERERTKIIILATRAAKQRNNSVLSVCS